MGIDLDKNPFHEPIRGRIEAAQRSAPARAPGACSTSSPTPISAGRLRDQVGDWELGNQAVTLAGGFPMLRGFAADSTVICSDLNFLSLCGFPPGQVSFGFLKVRDGPCDGTPTA